MIRALDGLQHALAFEPPNFHTTVNNLTPVCTCFTSLRLEVMIVCTTYICTVYLACTPMLHAVPGAPVDRP